MFLLSVPDLAKVAALVLAIGVIVAGRRRPGMRGLAPFVVLPVAVLLFFQATPIPKGAWSIAFWFNLVPHTTLADLDFALSRIQREEVVRLAGAGALEQLEDERDYHLPDGYRGLADREIVEVWECEAGGTMVFFRTITGFSPDPYGGFEYVPPGCTVEADPHGSGAGVAHHLGDSWYWIIAR
jgi:hypothetical protein